jgi:hypothetical protein
MVGGYIMGSWTSPYMKWLSNTESLFENAMCDTLGTDIWNTDNRHTDEIQKYIPYLLLVFHTPLYCSFTSNLTMFSLITDYWRDSGIFIMIIINLIIDKSRLCHKITIKYWQNVPYSQLYLNKTQIKISTQKKNPHILRTPIFQRPK